MYAMTRTAWFSFTFARSRSYCDRQSGSSVATEPDYGQSSSVPVPFRHATDESTFQITFTRPAPHDPNDGMFATARPNVRQRRTESCSGIGMQKG